MIWLAALLTRAPYLLSSLIKCRESFSDQSGNLMITTHQGLLYNFLWFRFVATPGYGISCISWRSWISREARDPSLLVNSTDGSLRLYRYVVTVTLSFSISLGYTRILPDGNIYLKRKFAVPHNGHNIRSAFCPLMSFLQGACVGECFIRVVCGKYSNSFIISFWQFCVR